MNKIIKYGIIISIFTILSKQVYSQSGVEYFSVSGKVFSETDSLPIENILISIKDETYTADTISHTNNLGYFSISGFRKEYPMFETKEYFTLQFKDEDKNRKIKFLPKDTTVILDNKEKIIYLKRRR